VQGIAQLLGDHDAASLVDLDGGIHNAILPLNMAFRFNIAVFYWREGGRTRNVGQATCGFGGYGWPA
jgi:hypothetical protein